jgi:hypothetical protein
VDFGTLTFILYPKPVYPGAFPDPKNAAGGDPLRPRAATETPQTSSRSFFM